MLRKNGGFYLIAELRAAPLPKLLNKMAIHLYFNFYLENEIERWELWQSQNAFETIKSDQPQNSRFNNGHIYKNLKSPLAGVGGGPSFGIRKWSGDDALKIYQTTCDLANKYQYIDQYRAWPGPNSNTFIATILKMSEIEISLPATAIGKDYLGPFPKFKIKQNKVHINLLTAGLKLSKKSYWELHFAGLTIGYEKSNGEWKLPYGKGIFPYAFHEESSLK
jgi:hypothetical protein